MEYFFQHYTRTICTRESNLINLSYLNSININHQNNYSYRSNSVVVKAFASHGEVVSSNPVPTTDFPVTCCICTRAEYLSPLGY